jgi:nicotinate phosphoribosyltransferase
MTSDAKPPEFETLVLREDDLSLATDLYQLTMAAVYHLRAPGRRGSFELFVRRLPAHRNFLVFAGLEQGLAALKRLRFTPDQIDYLRSLDPFRDIEPSFFDALLDFRFRARVTAMPEGTVFFPSEPVMRVTGDLLEAQLVETLLLSTINFQTTIASKAARVRLAAGEDIALAEFGGRRAHGPQAATWAARAAWLAGFDSTSNVLAGYRLGIPVVGTMAHSYVLSFGSEREAFEQYVQTYPRHTTFLVDTYDTLSGVRTAIDLNVPFDAVRLDSGDIGGLARETRALLDRTGHEQVRILASGDMNEARIARLRDEGAPVDAYGVGTQLVTSADAPYTGGIYKLVDVELDDEVVPRQKLSTGKRTWPGKKQVYRRLQQGRFGGDRLAPFHGSEPQSEEHPLLEPVMDKGRILIEPSLAQARGRCLEQLGALPDRLRELEPAKEPYEVVIDPALELAAEEAAMRASASAG